MLRALKRRAGPSMVGAMALVMAVSMVTAPQAGAANDVPFTDDHVTKVFLAGSDTTYFVMADLAKIYNESEGCRLEPVTVPVTGEPHSCTGHTHPAGPAQTGVNTLENYDHDVVVNYFPQGSNDGRRLLCMQTHAATFNANVPTVHAARSSSIPTGTADTACNRTADGGQAHDNGVFRFIAFAKDGLSWVCWEDTAADADADDCGQGVAGADPVAPNVLNLTQAQLNSIFVTCGAGAHGTYPDGTKIQWWSDYIAGAPSTPINVFTAIPGSGTRSSWDGFVGGNSENCIPADVDPGPGVKNCRDRDPADGCARVVREHFVDEVENADAIGDTDAADEGESIYYLSVGRWWADAPAGAKGNSQIQQVNGIAGHPDRIIDNTFPFRRNVYNVVRQGGTGRHAPVATAATLRFLGSNSGTNQSWLCRPLNGHSKPVGDPGPGIDDPNASKNYAEAITAAYNANGFIPLTTDPAAGRCTFTDLTVDYLSLHDGAAYDHPDDAGT